MTIPMEDSAGWLLNFAGRLATRQFAARLQPFGVTPPQWSALLCLTERDGQSLSEIGAWALFDGPTMTGIVDRLEASGFVERRRDSSDRRVINLYLTSKGRGLIASLPPIAEDTDARMLAAVQGPQLDCFIAVLRKVVSNLSEAGQ